MSKFSLPDDAGVFGPVQLHDESYLREGVHYADSCVALPGVPRTNDLAKVTCKSCRRALRNKT
jgi:hypothetical protein